MNKRSHAVIIGGSMAGLLTARTLLNHFERVTVVERDPLPTTPELRQGVPQAFHVHVLLARGQQVLEQLFPGIRTEMMAAGAPTVDWMNDCSFLGMAGWLPRCKSNAVTYTCSRVFLEWLVRQRLLAHQQLQFLPETQVKGLLSNGDRSRITGIKLHARRTDQVYSTDPTTGEDGMHASAQDPILQADLVVDASGRNSLLPQWLKALGYAAPTQTVVNSFLGYSTRWYEKPEHWQAAWKAALVTPKAPIDRRSAVLYPVEGNRWAITLAGIGRDYPPTDEQEFLEFARSLRSPVFYDAIQASKPVSQICAYRRTENCWRHYETLDRMPEGIVVIGDAVCAFNPVYGQGMTVAALSAVLLDQCLAEHHRHPHSGSLTPTFQKRLAQILKTPWLMATGEDFRWPTTEGGQPDRMTQFMHRYIDQVLCLAVNSADIARTFCEVAHLLHPPAALFQPAILMRVLYRSILWGDRPIPEPQISPQVSAKP